MMPTTNPSEHPPGDELLFSTPEQTPSAPPSERASTDSWKVMVIDDDESIHTLSSMVLQQFSFMGYGLEVIHGYSGEEARQLLKQHPDTAVMLLDVVMENDQAGLEVVDYVREALGNKRIQIILRTGQPGMAPEEEIVQNYEINDYKDKSELTAQKLYTALITSLRAFRDMTEIQAFIANSEQLESTTAQGLLNHDLDAGQTAASITSLLHQYASSGLLKEKFMEIVDHSSTVLYLKDCEGRYLLINNEFETLFNVNADDTIGKTDHEIFQPPLAEQIHNNDHRALSTQTPIQYFENYTRGDTQHAYITMKFAVHDQQQQPLGVCAISIPLAPESIMNTAPR